jgi:hypothetical protein
MSLTIKRPSLQGATDTEVWVAPCGAGGVAGATGYNSDFVAYTTTTLFPGIGSTMAAGQLFMFQATTDCWIAQGTGAVVATKGAGSFFVQKGIQILIDGAQGAKLAVLQDAAGGNASLVQVMA